MKLMHIGIGTPRIGIIGRLHGNEALGENVIDLLRAESFPCTLVLVVANEEAAAGNVRYIDSDLNRSFPGDVLGNHEQRLATRVLDALRGCDYVIDIHSTTAITEPFIIMTKDTAEHWILAGRVRLSKVALISGALANGNALIDHAPCGISLEYPRTTSPEDVASIAKECIYSIVRGDIQHAAKDTYEAIGTLPKRPGLALENFQPTTIDGETFIPLLFGEVEYKDIACLKARRISGTGAR